MKFKRSMKEIWSTNVRKSDSTLKKKWNKKQRFDKHVEDI